MEILEKFLQPKCKKCGRDAEITLEDDGGCSDPECCGGASYWIEISCPNCGAIETVR